MIAEENAHIEELQKYHLQLQVCNMWVSMCMYSVHEYGRTMLTSQLAWLERMTRFLLCLKVSFLTLPN